MQGDISDRLKLALIILRVFQILISLFICVAGALVLGALGVAEVAARDPRQRYEDTLVALVVAEVCLSLAVSLGSLVCSFLWLVLTAWPCTRARSCRGDYAPCISFTCDFASDNVWAVLWGLIFVLSVVSLSARVTVAVQFVGLVLSMVMLVSFLVTAVLSGLVRAGLSALDVEAGGTWVTVRVTPAMSKQSGHACGAPVHKQQCESLHTLKGAQGGQNPTQPPGPPTHHKHTSHAHHIRHSRHTHHTQHTPYASTNSSSSTNSTAALISPSLSAPASTPRTSFTAAAATTCPASLSQQQQQQSAGVTSSHAPAAAAAAAHCRSDPLSTPPVVMWRP